jgi:DNA-binding MarR family transcriptional regulator
MIFHDDFWRFFELSAIVYMKTRRAAQVMLKPFGLTYDQFGALIALSASEGMSQRKLAAVLETDTPPAMVICDGLEKKGMLERRRDGRDRRINRLHPTAAGRRALGSAMTEMKRAVAPFSRSLPAADFRRLLPFMEKAAAAVKGITSKKVRAKG